MKYIIITIAVFAAIVIISVELSAMADGFRKRHGKPPMGRGQRSVWFICSFVVLVSVVFFGYFSGYYHADDDARKALLSEDGVAVTKLDSGWFFDGSGEKYAVIFFPGAKVECESYAPLMKQLAGKGIDAFLVDPPLNMAILGTGAAAEIMDEFEYDEWSVSGHSLGGTAAAGIAAEHPDDIKSLILLAAYPSKEIPGNVRLCSIYGDADEVLELNEYEKHKKNWPPESEEFVINGGNHSGFGNYG
ncbi:MAG: hypothetical protein IIY88_02350, partial [Eubacterium sp.]|nr:hypothetical protein [Eubacterium sp.]